MMSPRLHIFVRQEVLRHRPGRRVRQLVNQQMVADEQRVLHRPGGNYEGLHERGRAEQQQDDGHRPLGDHAPWNIGFPRRFGLLRRLFGYAGFSVRSR